MSAVDYDVALRRQLLGQSLSGQKRPRVLSFAPPKIADLEFSTEASQSNIEDVGRRHISVTPDRILDAPGAHSHVSFS